jgi:hypothetical protein
MYGPVVLAGLTEQDRYFFADVNNLESWIKPVEGQPLTFRTTGQTPDMTFIPLNKVLDEHYGVYWVITSAGSPRHKKILAEEEARRKREERFFDHVVPDAESETAHNLQGERTGSGPFGNKAWRHAINGGWWSWDMKVLPDTQMTMACTYWGSDVGQRTFDILVDSEVIATQSLDRSKPGEFFDVEYALPMELTKGKEKVTVRFHAREGNFAGGVFECAILKPEE